MPGQDTRLKNRVVDGFHYNENMILPSQVWKDVIRKSVSIDCVDYGVIHAKQKPLGHYHYKRRHCIRIWGSSNEG